MNPLNYLHLSQPEVDIRGSQIAIYYRFDRKRMSSTTVVLNFQDGRWSKVIQEPINRINESFRNRSQSGVCNDPLFVHIIYMTSALRWWNNALNSFNDQLIDYVSTSLMVTISS